jgi:hypothetical protein
MLTQKHELVGVGGEMLTQKHELAGVGANKPRNSKLSATTNKIENNLLQAVKINLTFFIQLYINSLQNCFFAFKEALAFSLKI